MRAAQYLLFQHCVAIAMFVKAAKHFLQCTLCNCMISCWVTGIGVGVTIIIVPPLVSSSEELSESCMGLGGT